MFIRNFIHNWPRNNVLSVLLLVVISVILYGQFFFQGRVPMPGDLLIGAYYPWLDSKFGFPVGVLVKNPIISDVFSQFYPWKYFAIEMLKIGEFPLWNPYSFSGTPFLATYHSAALLPFNLFLLLPKHLGWGVYIWMQTLLAMIGMYFFLGMFKNSLAKIAGSIVFGLSGLMTTWVEFGTGVYAAATLPWILFFTNQLITSSQSRILNSLLLVFSFSCLYLAGHAQLSTYVTILFFGYTVILSRKVSLQRIVLPISLWAISIGICAIQLLPAYEMLNRSIRSEENYSQASNFGLINVVELPRLFAADFFGNPTTYNYWGPNLYHEQSSFLGTVTVIFILALIAFQIRSRKFDFFTAIFIGSLFISIDSPIMQFVYSQNISLLTGSFASRALFLTSFSGAVLLAQSISLFLDDPSFRRFVNRSSLFLIAVQLSIIIGFFIVIYLIQSFSFVSDLSDVSKNLKLSIKNLIVPLLISFVLLLMTSKKIPVKLVIFCSILILFFDLSRYFLKYNPFVSSHLIFPTTPIHQFLQAQPGLFRIGRGDSEAMPPNTWIPYGLQSIEGYDPMILLNYAKFFNKANDEPYSNEISRYVELHSFANHFLDAMNMKYLVALKRDNKGAISSGGINYTVQNSGYPIVFQTPSTTIFQNPNAKDRAYFVPKTITASNNSELISLIDQPDFDPTQVAVTDMPINRDISGQGKEIKIDLYRPNRISLSAVSRGGSFAVLADTYDPGWQLYREGRREPLFQVNGALRGFYVPDGKSQFEMIYQPESFVRGKNITILSILTLMITLVAFRSLSQHQST